MKRSRNRISADLHDFFSFPELISRPFWSAVVIFLQSYARPTFTFPSDAFLTMWQVLLQVGSALVVLHVVEEDVGRCSSTSIYCDHCRINGWGRHPVCRKKYHFIIRKNYHDNEESKNQKSCSLCGNQLNLLDSRCKWCNSIVTPHDVQEWVHNQLQDPTHLLHGVIHSNGFGHLLTLNGKEGGSTILTGYDIMSFWDRLCYNLYVREISVMDISKKYGTEYRVLSAIIHGTSWYGQWGYKLRSGCYALTVDAYLKAIENLSNVPISLFFHRRDRFEETHLQTIILHYLSISETQLTTLKDLFYFIFELINKDPHQQISETRASKKPRLTTTTTSKDQNDIERVEDAMIKLLLVSGKWISGRTLKGTLAKTASSELLDHSLKCLSGRVAANGMVVSSRYNPNCTVEYRLEQYTSVQNDVGSNLNLNHHQPVEYLIHDLKFLYDSILNPKTTEMMLYGSETERLLIIQSVSNLLDCKQFIKDYRPELAAARDKAANTVNIWCTIDLTNNKQLRDSSIPPEIFILPQTASVGDLRCEATVVFQDIYPMLKRFTASKLLDFGVIHDSWTIKLLVGLSGSIRIEGRCSQLRRLERFRQERGIDEWIVNCICGAKDDDGERMLACDKCGVWKHSRCVGIKENDDIPVRFKCVECLKPLQKSSSSNIVLPPEGNQPLQKSSSSNIVLPPEGNQSLQKSSSSNIVLPPEGNQPLQKSSSSNIVLPPEENQPLQKSSSSNIVLPPEGNQPLQKSSSSNIVLPPEGNQPLQKSSSSNIVLPPEGNQSLQKSSSSNIVLPPEGNQPLQKSSSSNIVLPPEGNQPLQKSSSSNIVLPPEGNQPLQKSSSSNIMLPPEGNQLCRNKNKTRIMCNNSITRKRSVAAKTNGTTKNLSVAFRVQSCRNQAAKERTSMLRRLISLFYDK